MSLSTPTTIRSSISSWTGVRVEHLTYDWVIKQFKLLPLDTGECINSPIFHTINKEGHWVLSLYPQGRNEENAGYVSISLGFFSLYSKKKEEIKVHAELSIPQFGITHTFVQTYSEGVDHVYDRLIQRSELLDLCGPDDTFTIRCQMDIPWRIIRGPIDHTKGMEQAFDSQEGQLSQDFRRLFKESKFTDVTVIVGAQKFPAHKSVLAARSPVFSAIFEREEMNENGKKNELKIEKIEPDVVEAMLEFLYTDEVTDLEDLAYGLLEAANKYDIQRLKRMCEKVLYGKLDEDNAAEVFVHADLHRSCKLKQHVMEFMVDNLANVLESKSYKLMEKKYPALLMELIRSIAVRKK